MADKFEIKDELRASGMRATAPRVAVVRALRSSRRPLSHAELVEQLGEDDWDRATIFRNLVKLEQSGWARIASRLGGITRYEATEPGENQSAHVHPHFSCRDCGLVTCLPDATLRLPQDPVWREALQGADLQLMGRCPSCREVG